MIINYLDVDWSLIFSPFTPLPLTDNSISPVVFAACTNTTSFPLKVFIVGRWKGSREVASPLQAAEIGSLRIPECSPTEPPPVPEFNNVPWLADDRHRHPQHDHQ